MAIEMIVNFTGEKKFIRTLTWAYIGLVKAHTADYYVLEKVSLVGDTGRWSECLKTGTLNEVEPYPDDVLVTIERRNVVDITDWLNDLPREVK